MLEVAQTSHIPLILGLDAGGRPVDWLPWQEAVTLLVRDEIAWFAGSQNILIRGGNNHVSGERTVIELSSIVAIRHARSLYTDDVTPPLTNEGLFRRDSNLCLYCGERYPSSLLTRDHVVPQSRGGLNTWANAASSCRACNQRKSNMTCDEAGMKLLAVPYAPSRIENLLLRNKRVLADQMEFLLAHLPKDRRVFERNYVG